MLLSYAAAFCVGTLAAALEVSQDTVLLDSDVTTTISGTVEAREFDAAGKVRYLIRLQSTSEPKIRRPPLRVRLTARSEHDPVAVGAMISGRARLSAPSGPVMPGGYDFGFRAFIDGIGAHGYFYRAPQPQHTASDQDAVHCWRDPVLERRFETHTRADLAPDPCSAARGSGRDRGRTRGI